MGEWVIMFLFKHILAREEDKGQDWEQWKDSEQGEESERRCHQVGWGSEGVQHGRLGLWNFTSQKMRYHQRNLMKGTTSYDLMFQKGY